MTPEIDTVLLVALRVQGVASVDRLAAAAGTSTDEVREAARELSSAGLVTQRSGAVSGFALTPEGREALEVALAEEGLRGDEAFTDVYERFLQVNERFLRVASDWQVRRHGPVEESNDHSDPDYDHQVITRLASLHDRACVILRAMEDVAPRFARYRERLADCLRRIEDGDRSAFTSPLAESYHTVWFELHQDLLLTLGISREAEAKR